ncbi:MAG: hypothetical protein HFI99_15500 [Lachnospiraceae bacterium]|jgi:hypothetical protein|nr:hypothetical protein [Lachnospiraceae bacterium]
MEKIISVLTNNIVVIWIAPVITGIVVAILIKCFTIKKTKKEIKRANQEYKEAILPYVLQTIILEEKVIHGIRDAICIEASIPKKHMYSDEDLMNILIYDITKTRYSTEDRKIELIGHICKMFSYDKDDLEDIESVKDNITSKFTVVLGTGIGISCIISMIVIYAIKPEALNDPNGLVSTIVILLLMLAMICFTIVFLNSVNDRIIGDRGIIGYMLDLPGEVTRKMITVLYGKRNKGSEE